MSDSNVVEAELAAAQDTCSHCGAPQKDSKLGWCRGCGFVPRLGTFVELHPWDKEPDPEPQPEPKPKPANLLKMVPRWGWHLAGILAAIVVFSILGRLITPANSTPRMVWALTQLGIGVIAFLVGQMACFVHVIMETDKFTVLDVLLKPFAIWAQVLRDMPVAFKRLAVTTGGMMAALMALTVVGGIPYHKIWEGGPVAKAKNTLVQAITDAARKADNQDGLEKAIEDFAEGAVDKSVEIAKAKEKELVDDRRKSADCVIAGFVPAGNDNFSSLVLVSEVGGKVQFVGTVSDEIPPEVRAELNRSLRKIERRKPFVPCSVGGAVWVDPQLMLRVKFKDWTSGKQLIKPAFESKLAEINTK